MPDVVTRLWGVILTLLGVSVLCFGSAALAPGEYFDDVRLQAGVEAETLEAWRARHGLDVPWTVRYVRWLGAAAQGDFGTSLVTGLPVATLVGTRTMRTLVLAGASTLFAWAVALPLGLLTVARSRHLDGRVAQIGVTSLLAVPDIVLAIGAAWVAVSLGVLPVAGSLVVPILVLTLALTPALVRHVGDGVATVLHEPWVRAARARGLSRTRVLVSALRVASGSLAGLLGLSLGAMLGAALPIEVVFGWPGLGPLLVEATLARDLPVVVGAAIIGALVRAGGQMVGDACQWLADPRVR